MNSRHTFVVCAYGESPYLDECVNSLVRQSCRSSVLIATSTPNELIRSVARKYELDLHVQEGNSGISADWNYALSCAKTPLVTIAHQDDIYLPQYSERVLQVASRIDGLIIYFTNYGEIRDDGCVEDENTILKVKRCMLEPMKDGRCARSKFVRRRILSFGSAICCPSVTFNIENVEQPIFQQNMKCDLDWEAWERLSRCSGSFYYDSRLLMRHRIHRESETTHLIGDNTRSREDLAMLKKFWPSPIAHIINRAYSKSQKSNG